MPTTDLVSPNAIIPAMKVNGKKQALQEIAAKAAELTGQNERAILEILLQREKLGSTGVGNGVAIPHGKLPKLGNVFGLFARLERPVDFEALDGQPVDLIFLLLAPEGAGADHLKALARVARLLRDPEVARKLRASNGAEAIYAVLAMPSASARSIQHVTRSNKSDRPTILMPMRAPLGARRQQASVHADGFKLVRHRVGDGRLAGVGHHDRRAVGRVQREQRHAGLQFRRLRIELVHVLGADRLDVGDLAAAEHRKGLFRHHFVTVGCFVPVLSLMALDSFLGLSVEFELQFTRAPRSGSS